MLASCFLCTPYTVQAGYSPSHGHSRRGTSPPCASLEGNGVWTVVDGCLSRQQTVAEAYLPLVDFTVTARLRPVAAEAALEGLLLIVVPHVVFEQR